MPEFKLEANGIPFTVTVPEGQGRQAAVQALGSALDRDPDILTRKAARLGLSESDTSALAGGQGLVPETTTAERALIGAGHTAVKLGRGLKQFFLEASLNTAKNVGDKAGEQRAMRQLDELNRNIANDRDAFQLLDSQGVGAEDVGELIATLPVFILGAAGGPAGLAAAGAALGFAEPVEAGDSRLANTAVGGATGAAGGFLGRVANTAVRTVAAAPAEVAKTLGTLGLDFIFTHGAASTALVAKRFIHNTAKLAFREPGAVQAAITAVQQATGAGTGTIIRHMFQAMNRQAFDKTFPLLGIVLRTSAAAGRRHIGNRLATLWGVETVEGVKQNDSE